MESFRHRGSDARLASRGRIVLRLPAGEAPEHIKSSRDVAQGAAEASQRLDGGAVDAVFRRFSTRQRVTRAFHAAAHVHRPGCGHEGWDDVEQSLGLSRTFGVQVEPHVDVRALAAALRELAGVEAASPQYLCATPFARASTASAHPGWGHTMVGAERALLVEPGDPATLLGLVDSGVRLQHPELLGHLRSGISAVSLSAAELPEGIQLLTAIHDQRPEDDQGHGTGCAGIMAANGYRIPRGIAGASWVIPVKALSAARTAESTTPTAIGSLLDIDHAVKTAIDLGARVLNLSFGTPESLLDPEDPVPHVEIVRYALARDCVLVAASGNSGDAMRYFPAALPGVIAVGSVDEARRPSHFSTRGPNVCVCAPGEDIWLAGLDGYTEGDGTSFAAPFVAGACALLIARGLRRSTPLSSTTLRSLLMESAGPFASGADRRGCGAGILDIPAALRAVDEACALPLDHYHDDAGAMLAPTGAP